MKIENYKLQIQKKETKEIIYSENVSGYDAWITVCRLKESLKKDYDPEKYNFLVDEIL